MVKKVYAANTSVSVAQSVEEIEDILKNHGASAFSYAWQDTKAQISFIINKRYIRINVPILSITDKQITHDGRGSRRTERQKQDKLEQHKKEQFRALFLTVKSLFVGIELGIVTLDDIFQSWILLPSGKTIGEELVPQIETFIAQGQTPMLLPGGIEGR